MKSLNMVEDERREYRCGRSKEKKMSAILEVGLKAKANCLPFLLQVEITMNERGASFLSTS